MSKAIRMARLFVASVDCRLGQAIQQLLPSVEVVSIDRQPAGEIGEANKKLIEDNAEVLLADVPVIIDVANSAKKLKWAASTWAGVEKLVAGIDKTKPPPFIVTRTGGAFNKIMGEYVIGYILARERHIIQLAHLQDQCIWDKDKYRQYRSVEDLVIVILGLGEIGQEVARMCNAIGMKVIGVTRTPSSEERKLSCVSQYRTTSELPSVLSEYDYVCNILPSTQDTRGLLSGDVFSNCKLKRSVFINIGRGDIVDEQTLVKAVSEGWLGGAVLDVFQTEPLPPNSPLWKLPNVVITPHVAGVSLTSQVARSFVKNYELYIQDKPLNFVVDFERGY